MTENDPKQKIKRNFLLKKKKRYFLFWIVLHGISARSPKTFEPLGRVPYTLVEEDPKKKKITLFLPSLGVVWNILTQYNHWKKIFRTKRWGHLLLLVCWIQHIYICKYVYRYVNKYTYIYLYKYVYLIVYIYMCVYIYACIYIYICIYIHIYIHIYTYIHIYVYMCIDICICTYMYIQMHVNIHMYLQRPGSHDLRAINIHYLYIYIYIHVYTYIYTHTHMYVYRSIDFLYIHISIHIYTYLSIQWEWEWEYDLTHFALIDFSLSIVCDVVYRVAKIHRMPYLYSSFFAKEPYN